MSAVAAQTGPAPPESPTGPVRARAPVLDTGMSVSAAFAAVAATALGQIRANEQGVLDDDDPEYLHQMRVGLRRLRSSLSAFSHAAPEASRAPIARELKWLGAALAPARDWDVFVTETLPAIQETLHDRAHSASLSRSAAAPRRAAWRKARRALRSRRYATAGATVRSWIESHGWRGAASAEELARLDSPVRAYADAELERRYERVRKRDGKLGDLDAAELHRLRIAIKKLRYCVDFFGSLYDADRVRALRSKLSRLQEVLGAINDAATIGRLLESLAGARQEPALGEARALVLGWAAGRSEGMRGDLDRAWRAFRRTETYW